MGSKDLIWTHARFINLHLIAFITSEIEWVSYMRRTMPLLPYCLITEPRKRKVLFLGVFTESDDSFSLQSTSNLPSNIEFLTWLSSGACEVDSSIFTEISGSLVSSASSMNLISLSSRNAAWRKCLIQRLRERDDSETGHFNKYEEGVSQVSEN